MARPPSELTESELLFLAERHLGTLTTLRRDGSPHVTAIAFMFDPTTGGVSIITREGSQKVRNADRGGRAAVSQVDGRRWLTLEGTVGVSRDPGAVGDAEARFAARYRTPTENPERVAITIEVDQVLGEA